MGKSLADLVLNDGVLLAFPKIFPSLGNDEVENSILSSGTSY
jgi:hypothetical protein